MIANWYNSSGEFSLLAPISRTTIFLPLTNVGNGATKAARFIPGKSFKVKVEALRKPPVEPHETIAS